MAGFTRVIEIRARLIHRVSVFVLYCFQRSECDVTDRLNLGLPEDGIFIDLFLDRRGGQFRWIWSSTVVDISGRCEFTRDLQQRNSFRDRDGADPDLLPIRIGGWLV